QPPSALSWPPLERPDGRRAPWRPACPSRAPSRRGWRPSAYRTPPLLPRLASRETASVVRLLAASGPWSLWGASRSRRASASRELRLRRRESLLRVFPLRIERLELLLAHAVRIGDLLRPGEVLVERRIGELPFVLGDLRLQLLDPRLQPGDLLLDRTGQRAAPLPLLRLEPTPFLRAQHAGLPRLEPLRIHVHGLLARQPVVQIPVVHVDRAVLHLPDVRGQSVDEGPIVRDEEQRPVEFLQRSKQPLGAVEVEL